MFKFNNKTHRKHVFGEITGYYFSLAICRILKVHGHFEDNSPQLDCQYPKRYVGFIWQKVKQSVKAHGLLVHIVELLHGREKYTRYNIHCILGVIETRGTV